MSCKELKFSFLIFINILFYTLGGCVHIKIYLSNPRLLQFSSVFFYSFSFYIYIYDPFNFSVWYDMKTEVGFWGMVVCLAYEF